MERNGRGLILGAITTFSWRGWEESTQTSIRIPSLGRHFNI